MAYTDHSPYNQQHEELLTPSDFRKRDHEAVHGSSLLAPSRSTTPVPPNIPKRPDSRSALYDSGHETMVVDEEVGDGGKHSLLNVNQNLSVLGLQQQLRQQLQDYTSEEEEEQQKQRKRPVSYHVGGSATTAKSGNGLGQKQGLGHGHDRYSSYDYGVPINYRTGASEYYDDLDNSDASSKGVKVEVRIDSSATHTHTEPKKPASSQPQSRLSRQEQMLKRSSQVIPLHHKYNHPGQPKSLGHKTSNSTLVEPQSAATTLPPQKEMTKEEREKLEKVFKKKRSLSEKYGSGGALPPARLENVAANSSQGYLYGDDGSSDGGSIVKKGGKGRWIDRPCGCLPAGLITFLAFKISLLYNGAIGAILFQASQYHEVGMSPIFGFTITYFLATAICALGLITVGILASRNYHTGKSIPSRLPLRVFKLVHSLYLLCSVIATTACMLAWLALNNSQTGTWDRILLPSSLTTGATTSSSGIISNSPVLSIESILKPDPNHAGWLIVNPWLWMFAFLGLGAMQLYFWFCMVAYARSHLAQWRSGFQTRMRRLEALRALEDGVSGSGGGGDGNGANKNR
ncbi:hypothetical protein BGZ96_000941 [Linnemannia gamsii]|uniref:Transmembrane protein n=1 Tax=Linnemannia gamsii TaxID=64522 RepID=A0ABQ7JNH5_9FUNG|nr:hypothetical protein BGZ96_000941 [Linnemannia gamsii]